MKNRAFTLIELLVVIAIIAILAAILFPVFAQAKSSAKASVALSNTKQIMTSSLLYTLDSDDIAPVLQTWDTVPRTPASLPAGGYFVNLWTESVQPYMKSKEILVDPTGPGWRIRTERSWTEEQSRYVMTGFSYNFTAWSPLPLVPPYNFVPKSMTENENTASTVFLAGSMVTYMDSKFGVFYTVNGKPSWINWGFVDSPACGTWNVSLCLEGWGNSYNWQGYIENTGGIVTGGRSGGVSARVAGMTSLGFGDGHVKRMPLSRAAAGTNWTPDRLPSQIVVTDKSQYLWGPY